MRRLLYLLLILSVSTASAATLYRWVDSQGVVHYSDRPQPGAQVIEQQSAQTFSAPETSTSTTASQQRPGTAPAGPAYSQLDLWKPENGETFTNTSNRVEVRLRLEPDLQTGHSIWLYLDGKRVDGLPRSGESYSLDNVWRGSHTLYAAVADNAGNVLIRSSSVSFEMKQASLLNPNRAR